MSLLRPLSIFLRNTLVKQHPYFSCCASCGEIKTPLENRLCTSLDFPFTVDAVVMGDAGRETAASITALERHCPWLRHIFIMLSDETAASGIRRTERVRPVFMGAFMPPGSPFGPEAHCRNIPGISEYFLIVPPSCLPKRDLLPLDFFTPNGIPLLRLRKTEDSADILDGYGLAPGIMAQTGENAAAFLREAGKTASSGSSGYFAESSRHAFAAGTAVPVKG